MASAAWVGLGSMGTKTASVRSVGSGLHLIGRTGSGHDVPLDDATGDAGARPAELIPLALAGCTAMDVISILRKKRQDVASYEVRVAGVQADEHPNAFMTFDVIHEVAGPGLDVEAVRRAIELSATRYCSVGATLAGGSVTVDHHSIVIDTTTGREVTGTVVRIGPLGAIREPALV